MTLTLRYNRKHSQQEIDLWLIHEQKSIRIKRAVYNTSSADYVRYQGCIVSVRGRAGGVWHGNY